MNFCFREKKVGTENPEEKTQFLRNSRIASVFFLRFFVEKKKKQKFRNGFTKSGNKNGSV